MNNSYENATTGKLWNFDEVSIKGFCDFCKNNILLMIATTIALFFAFGFKLFNYSIGIDTEIVMTNYNETFKIFTSMGRFGLTLFSYIFWIKEFNPYTGFFIGFCLIWFFTISWCYVISIFCKDTGKNYQLIPFALVAMTMPVWAEQFYFVYQATENALIISLCPYVIYLLFKGFLNDEKGKIAIATLMVVFITSVYQAIVPLFFFGVSTCFLLFLENSTCDSKTYLKLFIKLVAVFVTAMLIFTFIYRIIIPYVLHIEQNAYVGNMNKWGTEPLTDHIGKILLFIYTITLGSVDIAERLATTVVSLGTQGRISDLESFKNPSRIFGNIFLLPITILFIIQICRNALNKINNSKYLYILLGICIPFSMILLSILGGTTPPMRTLYSLPFAFAFMLFYLIREYKGIISAIIFCIALIIAFNQAQITSQLFHSDFRRYQDDVRFAHELNGMISQTQPDGEVLPILLLGKYQPLMLAEPNFLRGDVIGYSFFEWGHPVGMPETVRGITFMETLGFYHKTAGSDLSAQISEDARISSMPSYPHPDCVAIINDVIVIKLSDITIH